MKKLLAILFQLLLIYSASSQNVVYKHWDARFGGTDNDYMVPICQTTDGGFILAGTSSSGISGNKTQASYGGQDFWIVKVDANGNYLWDQRYGGSSGDGIGSICATKDGGCILGGVSTSGISGDKTQPCQGDEDYWVVKVDSLGNKQWDKTFGGSEEDDLTSVKCTRDGGYILVGSSYSGVSGDKTQPNWDPSLFTADYWVVKIDSAGNKQWDKRFGTIQNDGSHDIIQTPDGGYLVGGSSPDQDTSGDKTQVNFANGDNFWIVKIDSAGNKLWDKVYGGTQGEDFGNSLLTPDGNYLLGGTSYDGISGDKTSDSSGYWLIKIDTAGNKLGDWAYGGGSLGSVSNTTDKGYLLTGIAGNIWTVKTDSLMNMVWSKSSLTIGSTRDEYSAGALEVSAGCYLVGVETTAGVGGDKTQPNWDTSDATYDYWIVEYCDSPALGIQQPEGDMHLLIYPNPTSADLYINIQKDNLTEASFTLTNTTGQTIYQSTDNHLAHSYTKILDLSKLPTGVYMLDVVVDGERIVKKVLKE